MPPMAEKYCITTRWNRKEKVLCCKTISPQSGRTTCLFFFFCSEGPFCYRSLLTLASAESLLFAFLNSHTGSIWENVS